MNVICNLIPLLSVCTPVSHPSGAPVAIIFPVMLRWCGGGDLAD